VELKGLGCMCFKAQHAWKGLQVIPAGLKAPVATCSTHLSLEQLCKPLVLFSPQLLQGEAGDISRNTRCASHCGLRALLSGCHMLHAALQLCWQDITATHVIQRHKPPAA
jgi:hypothetical protein